MGLWNWIKTGYWSEREWMLEPYNQPKVIEDSKKDYPPIKKELDRLDDNGGSGTTFDPNLKMDVRVVTKGAGGGKSRSTATPKKRLPRNKNK